MALTDQQRKSLLGFIDVLFTPAQIERARRVDQSHTDDGRIRAEMLTGEVPGYVLPMIELGQLPAPDGTGYDTLEQYIDNLTGAFLPTGDPTFTGTLTGPDASITNDLTVGDDLHVTDDLSVDGDSTLGNGSADIIQVWGHFTHKGTNPTIAVGAALGTGGSVGATVTGTAQAGEIALTAGNASLGTGTAATITFATARPDTNYSVDIQARGSTAGVNAVQAYASRDTTTTWKVFFNVAPTSGGIYAYHYQIIEFIPV